MTGAKMALVAEIAESIAKLRQAVKLENLAAKVKGIFKVGAKIDLNEWLAKLDTRFVKVQEVHAGK